VIQTKEACEEQSHVEGKKTRKCLSAEQVRSKRVWGRDCFKEGVGGLVDLVVQGKNLGGGGRQSSFRGKGGRGVLGQKLKEASKGELNHVDRRHVGPNPGKR